MQTKSLLFREFLSQTKKFDYIFVITVVITMLVGQVQILAADNQISVTSVQQQITVTGTVTDDQGEPLPGVNVIVKGTTIGQISNIDGKFSIIVPNEEAVLVFSFIGYKKTEVVVGSNRNLNITMADDTHQVDEVVVTGYGVSQKKVTLTGSISTINNKELTITKNENVVNMLAGKMPGLRISQRTAQPGAYNTVIDVRGFGEPLFVIDGVSRDKDYFARMNPEDIESISLLKDASAAIYGIRASNGVMLITTKKGVAQDGKVDITYSGNFSLQQMLFIPNGYTIAEWMTLRNEQEWKNLNDNMYWHGINGLVVHKPEEIEAARSAQEYNWQEKIFRKFTPQTQHNLSVNGGSEKLRYYFSLGYQRQDGCYSSGSLWADRWNFRSNVDAKITQRLSASVSVGATLGSLHEPNGGLWDVYKATWLQIPGTPFYANDNPEYLNGTTQYNPEFTNLIGKTDHRYVGYFVKNERRLDGSLALTYEIPGVKGLSVKAFYNYFMNVPDETRYKKMYQTYEYDAETGKFNVVSNENGPKSTISRRYDTTTDTDMQLQISYANRFGQHSVNSTVVLEEQYSQWDNFTAQRNLELNTEYLFAGETEDQSASGGRPGDRSQRAFIGMFSYNYAEKYMVDFIFRYEASSKWPKDTRWGFFPGVTAGWRISEEGFIKNNIDFISNLKLRASYGKLGSNERDNNYPDTFVGYDTWNRSGWIFSDGVPTQGIQPTAIPNPKLTWMAITMKNIALDFAILKNKISGTFELFQRDRDGILATSSAVVPQTVGAKLPDENLNSDRYQGWEIELAHHNRIAGVDYFVSGQISHTRRKWLSKLEEPASDSFDHWKSRYSGRYHNDDFWWGQESGGMFTSLDEIRNYQATPMGQGTLPGDWWRVDWNGDGIINGDDDHPVATKGLPYFNYGFTVGASYMGFDLQANFQGAAKVYKQLSEVFVEALPFGGQNSMNWFLDRWRPVNYEDDWFSPNTQWIPGYYPVTGNGGRREGTNAIMNASYCRLKTLEIGYSLPGALLSKIGLKSLRVYLSGYNLLTFTPLRNIDPERPSSEARAGGSDGGADKMYVYPNDKMYTIGASIKF